MVPALTSRLSVGICQLLTQLLTLAIVVVWLRMPASPSVLLYLGEGADQGDGLVKLGQLADLEVQQFVQLRAVVSGDELVKGSTPRVEKRNAQLRRGSMLEGDRSSTARPIVAPASRVLPDARE